MGGSGPAAGEYPQFHHDPSRGGAPSSAVPRTGSPSALLAQIISCLRCFSKTHSPRLPKEHISNFHLQRARRGRDEVLESARSGAGCAKGCPEQRGSGPSSARGESAQRSRARPAGPVPSQGLCAAPRPLPAGGMRGAHPGGSRSDEPAPPPELRTTEALPPLDKRS